jgi:hypothetical protein
MAVGPKKKEERIAESVKLLKNMEEIGILETCEGYIEFKKVLNTWVTTGEAWKGKIRFHAYGRMADVILPSKDKSYASVMLRVI